MNRSGINRPGGDGRTAWEDLFHRVLDGGAEAQEIEQLHQWLARDPEARDAWIRLTHLHAELASGVLLESSGELVRGEPLDSRDAPVPDSERVIPMEVPRRKQFGRIAAALTAGLVLGGFGNSALRAVTEPRLGRIGTLLSDSFDSEVAPRVDGPVTEPGVWGGDFTELVGESKGVRPRTGPRMLRFCSSVFEGKKEGSQSYISDVYRLLDVRSFARELATGELSLRVSAHFNAEATPEAGHYSASIYLHAVSGETIRNGLLKSAVQQLLPNSLAVSIANTSLDRDPASWQQGTAELRLPPQTEFVLVHLMMAHPGQRSPEGPRTFSGHFLDDVQAVLLRRASRN
jgi:hypothetical protein